MTTNIRTNNPQIGDAVIGNLQTGKVEFIKGDTFSLAALNTAAYETIGAVYGRRGRQVKIVYKENTSKPYGNLGFHRLTGYTLDGTARTGVLSIREASDNWGAQHNYTIGYNASTLEEFVAQLNAAFLADSGALKVQGWKAHIEGGDVVLTYSFTSWQQASYNTATTGFTMTGMYPETTFVANIRRRNGATGGEGVISNFERAVAYFRGDNSSTTYNPNTDVTNIKRTHPICLPGYLGTSQYQSDHCKLLRDTFGEGEEGWLNFMRSCLPVKPCENGNMGSRDGLERTIALYKYTDGDGAHCCPAAEYCYTKGTRAIPQGNWYLPTVEDLSDLLDNIKYGTNSSRTADPINATLYKMGGTAISNGSNAWTCCRCGAGGAWCAYGGYGYFGNNSVCNSFLAVPVALFNLEN